MSDDEPITAPCEGNAPYPAAPPIAPQTTDSEPVAPAWPSVLGAIAIVFGVLGALVNTWAILTTGGTDEPARLQAAYQYFRVPLFISGVLMMATSLLLLVCGIGLVRQRRWSPRAITLWAAAKIFVVLIGGLLGYLYFEYIQRDQPLPAGGFPFEQLLPLITVIATLLWGWALPIFIFVWFGREKVREEVRSWR